MPTATPPAPPPAVAADTASRLRFAVTRLARLLRYQDGGDLEPASSAALATIWREGPLALGDLAARERVAPPTVTRLVGRLEERGLVARRVDDADRRVSRVAITAAGLEHLEGIRTRRTAWLSERLASLSDDERARLDAALDVLEALVVEPVQP